MGCALFASLLQRRKRATRELRGIVSSPPRGTPHKSGQRTEARAGGRASLYPEARCRQNLDLHSGIGHGSVSVNQSRTSFSMSCFAAKRATRS